MDVWKGNLGAKGYDFRALLSNMCKYRTADAKPSDLSFVLSSECLVIFVQCTESMISQMTRCLFLCWQFETIKSSNCLSLIGFFLKKNSSSWFTSVDWESMYNINKGNQHSLSKFLKVFSNLHILWIDHMKQGFQKEDFTLPLMEVTNHIKSLYNVSFRWGFAV